MGGEDWERWIDQLNTASLLADNVISIAYSYIGPDVTKPLYGNGTIGKAKEDLEESAKRLTEKLKNIGGRAFISVNKGVVTRASAVIPVMPLYIACLFKLMKKDGTHEGCIEQINRLFSERLYIENGNIPLDEKRRIRINDLEMNEELQERVKKLMAQINEENAEELLDLAGYRHDFLAASGFYNFEL